MAELPQSTVSSNAAPRSRTSGITRQAIFWKAFDLDSKRLVLDTQGNAMKTEKDASFQSRKKLAETTKSFRKLADADKITSIPPLLRAYQEEIDRLTTRAKYSENAFFQLYKGLFAAPDPVAALEASAANDARMAEVDETNRRLQRDVHELESEFATLKNQDITIRRLEAQVRTFEHELDTVVEQRVAAQCEALEAQLAARAAEQTQQQIDFERQLTHSRNALRDANSRIDAMQTELFTRKQQQLHSSSGFDAPAAAAVDAELQLLQHDALILQTLQLENAQLRSHNDELIAAANGPMNATANSSLHTAALADRDAVIQSLRHEILRVKEAFADATATAARDRNAFETATTQLQTTVDALTLELTTRPSHATFTDVLHQLHVLQQLEFNIVDDDANDDNEASDAIATPADDPATTTATEKILVARVRRLERALQHTTLDATTTSDALVAAQLTIATQQSVIHDHAMLVQRLEEHVATLERRKRTTNSSSSSSREQLLLDAVEEDADDMDIAPLDALNANRYHTTTPNASDDRKMLEIVRSQRDRFRDRVKALERESSQTNDKTASLTAAVARLENDNMQLYHKIRYLQSYRSSGNGSNGSSNGQQQHVEDNGAYAIDVETKYRSLYEEKLNPFVQFNRMETQQRIANLNTVDRVLLTSARMFLGHRVTRNIAFGYIVLLHFLVFATLYSFMHGCGVSND